MKPFFTENTNNISYISHNFKDHFGDMAVEIPKKLKLEVKVLEKNMTNQEILNEFKPKPITLGQLAYCVKNPENCGLRTDGWANLFFIKNKANEIWLVSAYLFSVGWDFSADPLDGPDWWRGVGQVFSRKFSVLGDSETGNLDGSVLEINGDRYKLSKIN